MRLGLITKREKRRLFNEASVRNREDAHKFLEMSGERSHARTADLAWIGSTFSYRRLFRSRFGEDNREVEVVAPCRPLEQRIKLCGKAAERRVRGLEPFNLCAEICARVSTERIG